jgi:hypothetical protein
VGIALFVSGIAFVVATIVAVLFVPAVRTTDYFEDEIGDAVNLVPGSDSETV